MFQQVFRKFKYALVSLDNEIADKGGRIYLAKDSRQSGEMFLEHIINLKNGKKLKEKWTQNLFLLLISLKGIKLIID